MLLLFGWEGRLALLGFKTIMLHDELGVGLNMGEINSVGIV